MRYASETTPAVFGLRLIQRPLLKTGGECVACPARVSQPRMLSAFVANSAPKVSAECGCGGRGAGAVNSGWNEEGCDARGGDSSNAVKGK